LVWGQPYESIRLGRAREVKEIVSAHGEPDAIVLFNQGRSRFFDRRNAA
jgi:hypothetical protein